MRKAASLLLLTAVLLAACAPAGAPSQENREIVRVHVKSDGTILMNEQPATLEAVSGEAKRLAASGGAILYSRDNPAGDPHPNAMKVIEALADSNVTILMSER